MNRKTREALQALLDQGDRASWRGKVLELVRRDGPLRREARVHEVREIDAETRTVELSFSSEQPVERWFGTEVLEHTPDAVQLERLNDGGALLFNHHPDQHLGVVESSRVDSDRVARATVRFGSGPLAAEKFRDVLDRILGKVSVGYWILDVEPDPDDPGVFRVTSWEPLEVSLVTIPADGSVGVGRSVTGGGRPGDHNREVSTVDQHQQQQAEAEAASAREREIEQRIQSAADEALRGERARREAISRLGEIYAAEELAAQHNSEGTSVEDFRDILDAFIAERGGIIGGNNRPSGFNGNGEDNFGRDTGLTSREANSFRFTRLLLAMAEPQNSNVAEAAAFELEACRAARDIAERNGIKVRGFMIPAEVMRTQLEPMARLQAAAGLMQARRLGREVMNVRALSAGGAGAGAELVATDLLSGNFIDVLRNALFVAQAGATVLADLEGNVAIPRKTSGSTAGWITPEGADAAESQPAFDQVPLTPRTVGAWLEVTRQLLLQSSIDVEAMVRLDLAAGIATTIDLAAHYGSGAAGQPTGIRNQTGVLTPTDFVGATPTWAEVVAMESAVAVANALMGVPAYFLRPDMRGSLKTSEKATNTAQFIWGPGETLNGWPAYATSQITVGDVFFGNYADALVGLWGGLDLISDPYTKSKSGTLTVVGHQSVDFAVRHPQSFAYNKPA